MSRPAAPRPPLRLSRAPRENRRGVGLAFVLLFLAFLSFMIVPIVDMFSYSKQTAAKAKNSVIALNLAAEMLEQIKATKFSDIKGMAANEWEPVEGVWFKEGEVSIDYPKEYEIFKRNARVTSGEEMATKDPDILKVVVTVKWEEAGEGRGKGIERRMKIATIVNRKERWE